jgi:hypothetical protein
MAESDLEGRGRVRVDSEMSTARHPDAKGQPVETMPADFGRGGRAIGGLSEKGACVFSSIVRSTARPADPRVSPRAAAARCRPRKPS